MSYCDYCCTEGVIVRAHRPSHGPPPTCICTTCVERVTFAPLELVRLAPRGSDLIDAYREACIGKSHTVWRIEQEPLYQIARAFLGQEAPAFCIGQHRVSFLVEHGHAAQILVDLRIFATLATSFPHHWMPVRGQYREGHYYVYDGMHRACLAAALGVASIPLFSEES